MRLYVGLALLLILGFGLVACPRPSPTPAFTPTPTSKAAMPGLAPRPKTVSESNASPEYLYIIAPSDVVSRLIVLNSSTFTVKAQHSVRRYPFFLPSPDPQYVFVLDNWVAESTRAEGQDLAMIDIETGKAVWTTPLPGRRPGYLSIPFQDEMWISKDGRFVYVIMDRYPLRLIVLDSSNGHIIREINAGLNSTKMWKLSWSETMVVATGRDPRVSEIVPINLVLLDLKSGDYQTVLKVPGSEDRSPVPRNLSQEVFVIDGDFVEETRTLYLATSRQEIVRVQLQAQPTAEKVLKLPNGWQFMATDALTLSRDGERIYLGVRLISSPNPSGLLGEEVWAYDAITRQKVGNVNPTDSFLNMRLSQDGQRLYALNPNTLTLSIIDTGTMSESRVIRNLGALFNSSIPFVWIVYPR